MSLFTFSGGQPRAAQLDGNEVGAVSASTGHILAAIPLSATPDAIAAGAASIWVAMSDRRAVSRIDPATNTVHQTIPMPGGPSAVTVGGGFVWVVNTLAATVAQIDPRTNGGQVVGKPIRAGNVPSGIAYGHDAVWVANSVDRTVVRIDPVTRTAGSVIDQQAGTVAITTTYGGLFEKLSITNGPTLTRDAGTVTAVDVYEYTGDPNDPVGDPVSEALSRLRGPHPDLLSGFTVFCDVLAPYLQGP